MLTVWAYSCTTYWSSSHSRPCRRTLRFLRLHLQLRCCLLLFALGDSFFASGFMRFRSLGASLFNHVEGSSDDTTPLLYGATGAFLSLFLWDTLFILPPIESRLCISAWVLALEEEEFDFAILKVEDCAVAADNELALVWIDFLITEGVLKVRMMAVRNG